MNDFFHMGGYAFYVWGCYGLTAGVLLANLIFATMRRKRILQQIQELSEED
ncbi:MAG: heme exporter protein CcmD [Gammaproteobacteria bacterium]|jgi:heme exporter protein D|nr:heme exporter protein CcmD [Gammaproteobacteria bacterium]